MKELKINKGIELILRRANPKITESTRRGLLINQVFTFLKRKVYFNFELRWENQ